jgi:hypothetical protein
LYIYNKECTDKKENQIFLIYKEIQNGAVAKSYLTITASSYHCKKELAIFPSPAGMSLTKLSLGGKKLNYSRPGRV